MNQLKPCMICSKELATQHCRVCGRLVCDTDFSPTAQTCNECPSQEAEP